MFRGIVTSQLNHLHYYTDTFHLEIHEFGFNVTFSHLGIHGFGFIAVERRIHDSSKHSQNWRGKLLCVDKLLLSPNV